MAGAPLRIGIFGGTFDPVHTAHLEVAQAVRVRLGLDRMLLVVANDPWQKPERPLSSAEDRYAVVEAATVEWPGLEPCRLELDRGGPSYTVETVDALREEAPDAELFLVVGSDVVADLPTWKDEPRLRTLVTLVIVRRAGGPVVDPPPGWRAVTVPVVAPDVSSTELRAQLEAGESVLGLVPEAAIRCISERGLYATRR